MTKLKKKKLSKKARRFVVLEDRGAAGSAAVYFDPVDDANHMAGREQRGELPLAQAAITREGAVITITVNPEEFTKDACKNAGVPLGFECDTEDEAKAWEAALQSCAASSGAASVSTVAAATATPTTATAVAAPTATAAVGGSQTQTLPIMCPAGAAPGTTLQIMIGGQPQQVVVPQGAVPGQPFSVQISVPVAPAPALVPTVTAAPQMSIMQVQCPAGVIAGQQIQVQGPAGVLVVQIPAGVVPGQAFTVQVPAPATGGAMQQQMMTQQQQMMMQQQQMMAMQQQQQPYGHPASYHRGYNNGYGGGYYGGGVVIIGGGDYDGGDYDYGDGGYDGGDWD